MLGRCGQSRFGEERESMVCCGNSSKYSQDLWEEQGRTRVKGGNAPRKAKREIHMSEAPYFRCSNHSWQVERGAPWSSKVKHFPHLGHKPECRCASPVWVTPFVAREALEQGPSFTLGCSIRGDFTEGTLEPGMALYNGQELISPRALLTAGWNSDATQRYPEMPCSPSQTGCLPFWVHSGMRKMLKFIQIGC